MSIIEPPFGSDLFDLSTEGGNAYARGAIIQAGVSEGYSIGSVRTALSGYGVSFAGSQVSDAYYGLSEALGREGPPASISLSSTGDMMPTGPPPDTWTGQYVGQVTATFRSRTEAGGYELRTRTFGVISDEPMSGFDATQNAMQIIESPIDEENADTYGSVGDLLTLNVTGAWYRTSPGLLSARAAG